MTLKAIGGDFNDYFHCDLAIAGVNRHYCTSDFVNYEKGEMAILGIVLGYLFVLFFYFSNYGWFPIYY